MTTGRVEEDTLLVDTSAEVEAILKWKWTTRRPERVGIEEMDGSLLQQERKSMQWTVVCELN
jgi:hypothetical protein